MSEPNAQGEPYYVVAENIPQIKASANDGLSDVAQVRVQYVEQVPYVQVHGLMGEAVLDLTGTEALNLAMLLIQGAGDAQARRIERLQAQERVAVYHAPNGTIGVYNP